MKIRLKNIKCYEDTTFDFGGGGIALLTGASGKGKSSIIQGIHFALFGSGSKIQSFGCTSCSVELEFDGIKVIRSKGPGKLTVTKGDLTVEGDEAQHIINTKFGDAFEVTGYIPQNAVRSFILMSATDKLSFLETFAFQGTDLVGMKKRCKEQIQAKHIELTEATAKLEAIVEVAGEVEEPEWLDFPIPVKNNNFEKAARNERVRLKNVQTRITKCNDELAALSDLHTKVSYNMAEISRTDAQIDEVNDLISGIVVDDVSDLRRELKFMESNRERTRLEDLKKDLDNMKHVEDEATKNLLTEAESELWLTYEEGEVREMISETQSLVNDITRLERLKRGAPHDRSQFELETELKAARNYELSKSYHSCPKCTARVRLVDGKLTSAPPTSDEKQPTETIDELQRMMLVRKEIDGIESQYEDDLPSLEDTKNDLIYLKQYLSNNLANQKIVDENKVGVYSGSVNLLDKKVKALTVALPPPSNISQSTSGLTEKEIRDAVERSDGCANELGHAESRLRRLTETKERYIRQLDDNLLGDVEADQEQLRTTLDKHRLDLSKHESNCVAIEGWNKRKEELSKFNEWNDKISHLEEIENKCREEYTAVLMLRDKILEAESIAMVNLVGSINTHARVYLDDFFEEDPIVVTLTAFKKTKSGVKPQISMDIEYKGMECDLQMLSGGEMSRIVLAYTLALAEMFNSPLLLLDECTSSLDQDTTNHVFDSIKENFNGKLTIIVAHQVVTGIFDRTVNL